MQSFALRFFVLNGFFFLIIGTRSNEYFAGFNFLTADILAKALRVFGENAAVHGDLVTVNEFSVRVITECSATYLLIIFSCYLLSVSAPVKKKFLGLFAGLFAIWVANQFRLLIIFLIGLKHREFFDAVHIYFGQIFVTGVTFFACLALAAHHGGRE